MVTIPNNQDLSAASGIINIPFLEAIYHSFMDDALQGLGGNRGQVIFHLPPIQEQDVNTQSQQAAQQYNPFFGGVPVPATNTRRSGTKVTPRDVQYTAHIVVGPIKNDAGDVSGMGRLNEDEARITVVVEALEHVNASTSISIEGRRYTRIGDPRPIGFSQRRYLIVKLRQIQETETPSPDKAIG